MKKLLVFLVALVFSVHLFGQISVFTNFSKENLTPTVIIANTKALNQDGSFGLNYYTLVNPSWAEVQIGFYKQSFNWMTWGLSLGLEQKERPLRAGGMLCLFAEQNSLIALLEKGGGLDNYWYNITAWHRFNQDFKIGLRAWRFNGIGPIMQFDVVNTNFNLWFMPAYDFEVKQQNIIFGINYAL